MAMGQRSSANNMPEFRVTYTFISVSMRFVYECLVNVDGGKRTPHVILSCCCCTSCEVLSVPEESRGNKR